MPINRVRERVLQIARVSLAALAGLPGAVWANNGLVQTGYGMESSVMGGADIAVARDTSAVNTNAAGLTQIPGRAYDVYLTGYDSYGARHQDIYGNDRALQNRQGGFLGASYSQGISATDLTAGLGLLAQGGSGFVYKDLNTAFGTRDEASAVFGIIRLVPALAWKMNDRLSVGAALGINYATAKQTFFPNTSVYNQQDPAASFFGLRVEGLSGLGVTGRFGFQYRPLENLTLAMTYGSKTSLPLKGGTTEINYEAIGQGRVRYGDTKIEGMGLPQDLAVGLSFRPIWPLLVALEVTWLDWSDTMKSTTLTATRPDNNGVPAEVRIVSAQDWRDQYVYSAGLAYDYDDKTILRGGINYARQPIPTRNLGPTFALIQSGDYGFGVSRRFGEQWRFAVGAEYFPLREVTYTNTAQPFGPNARVEYSGIVLHFMMSRRW